MNGPGVSLFQGAELQLNQTNPDEEEAENAAEEQRKNAELRNLLNGAFDDLDIHHDADLSFASSKNLNNFSLPGGPASSDDELHTPTGPKRLTNGHLNGHLTNGNGDGTESQLSGHYNHCYHNKGAYADSSVNSTPVKPKVTAGGDAEHLATLYEVRMREIVRLQDVLEAHKRDASNQVERLNQKILLLEAERVATKSTLTQSQALLVSAKEQVQELLKQVEYLKKQNKELEDLKDELEQDGLIMRANIESLNSKMVAMEKISNEASGVRQADLIVKSLEERHRKEIISYQVQIEELKDKLNNSTDSIRNHERRIMELSRQQEMMMLEKADSINSLARALAESQQHCQELMAADNTNASVEIKRLRDKIKQQEGLIEKYKIDVDQLEMLVGLSVLTSDSSSLPLEGRAGFYKTGLDSVESLREELAKSLRYHEARRAEIKQLQYVIQEKEAAAQGWQKQEEKYKTEMLNLKAECDKLANELEKAKSGDQGKESQIRKENADLQEKISHLEEAIARLQEQNTQLAEQSVELQRICDEEKLKVIDDHSKEYVRFHNDALARARQEEKDKLHKEMQKLRLQLEFALEDADKAKQAYINLVTTKNAITDEMESQRKILGKLQNQVGSSSSSKHDLGEMHIAVYEERVRREIENAKKEMLEEIAKEKGVLMQEAKLEAEKELQSKIDKALDEAKSQWKKTDNLEIRQELELEINKLKAQLEKQVEEAKLQKKQLEDRLWSQFHEELMRMDQFQSDMKFKRMSDQVDGKRNDNDTSIRKTHSLNNLETRIELEECVKRLSLELEESKKVHSQRLMELQELLFTKQKEMEEFKQRMLEYTKSLHEGREKQNEQYISALKQEIEGLTEELAKKSSHGDLERLKQEKRKVEAEAVKMRRVAEKYKERIMQAKDFYERKEKIITEEFKRKEDKYYEVLLKLKCEVDSFNVLGDFTSADEADRPVKL
ncbi:early endosome antigen 1-like [Neocloeon triangulifer]|uniref:early endosome antigen 1-like n=1 Tax=Neocloeon triangulifer TaxID=2078957 RepID=UPI00286F0435|nr:early endosome antigen 1-like [Neocloeon triangulifer]